VARYDRCFWLAAAGKSDMAWEQMDVALLVREITTPAAVMGKGIRVSRGRRSQPSHGGTGQKRERKQQEACFRYNRQIGSCSFGQQCRFVHTCSACGGDHPATQCASRQTGKGLQQEPGGHQ